MRTRDDDHRTNTHRRISRDTRDEIRANRRQARSGGRLRYIALRRELAAAGCFARSPKVDACNIALVLGCFAIGYGVLTAAHPSWPGRAVALALIAFATVQAGFLGHDACHMALSRRRWLSTAWGHLFLTVLSGLSYSHFCHFHRSHHADSLSDLEKTGNAERVTAPSARLGVRGSRIAYGWLLVTLRGFALKLESLVFIGKNFGAARADAAMIGLHYLLWLVVPATILGIADAGLNYGLMTAFAGPYAGVVFLGNHHAEGVDASWQDASFLERQLSSTRNLGSSGVDDLLFGGINHHVEHHLYPTIPRARLPKAREIVRAFCAREQLPYFEIESWSVIPVISRRFAASRLR